MTKIEIESVRPLVTNEVTDGKTLTVTFGCPVSGKSVVAVHTLDPGVAAQAQMAGKVKKAALSSLRGPLSSALRDVFGSSSVGKILGNVASKSAATAISERSKAAASPNLAPAQRDAAIVEAFASVSNQFEWSPERGAWVGLAAGA